MIAGNVETGNAGLVQSVQLFKKKLFRLEAEPLVIKQIARDKHRMNRFRYGRVDGPFERAAQGIPQLLAQCLAATMERRIEVNIRQMKKPEHGTGCFYKGMRLADSVCSISSASHG